MQASLPRRVGIAGLGLIGGSLAQALARHAPETEVLACEPDPATCAAALAAGTVKACLPRLDDLLDACDLVVLCQPFSALVDALSALGGRQRWPVMCDVGSVKQPVLQAAAALGAGRPWFVGAHPIAGKAAAGWGAAEPGLFNACLVVLCPDAAEPQACAQVQALWQAVGARTVVLPAARHDAIYAALSHLPQLLTWVYLAALADAPEARDVAEFAGPGFASFTRLGQSDPALWAGIALHNRTPLLQGLDRLDRRLDELRAALQHGDKAALLGLFTLGREGPPTPPT